MKAKLFAAVAVSAALVAAPAARAEHPHQVGAGLFTFTGSLLWWQHRFVLQQLLVGLLPHRSD